MDDVANIARAINCSYRSLPFNYLELLVGKRMNKVDAWNGVVGKLSERLATWKINLLFIGGRLTLFSLSVIEALRETSFEVSKKMRKGLFRWRYLNEAGALWRKVISKIHGSDGGFETISGSGQKDGVWANIIGCCSELNQMGISFSNLMVKKFSSMADRWTFLNGVWQGIWAWRRQPHGYALDDLFALTSLINGHVHDMSREDYWSWSLDKSVELPSSMGPNKFQLDAAGAFCLKYGFGGVLPSLLTPLSGTSFLEISASLKTNG
ncbi:hypothetical protein Tco_1149528 [Tanacetum coccineum]